MQHPQSTFDIMTPDGSIRITPEDNKKLLGGEMQFVKIGGVTYAAYELLDQEVIDSQTDLFDRDIIRMITEEAPEQGLAQTM